MTELFTRYDCLEACGIKVRRKGKDLIVDFDELGTYVVVLKPDEARALCAMLADTLEIKDPCTTPVEAAPVEAAPPEAAGTYEDVTVGGFLVRRSTGLRSLGPEMTQVRFDPSKAAYTNRCREADYCGGVWALFDAEGAFPATTPSDIDAARFVCTGELP